ncbi:metal ABC transporter permease [Candidatus Gottesmanbacteria bacterium RBG_13_45_10]|uniref:Metal ABC transporter permease n=1 Tax=Candidatus Gottesmanbacteria bacterium RBG_13_45_10 TaxID=1798370 RepID=A0A1F5ZGP9_9BACT|nr:MAG: metal ABC transporter permease [Candidatus Gottesmanbacteria bacterium RBG_13_45_10]
MLELFTYGFIIRGLEAGIIVGIIAPLIGIFLVLRRYSLIADTLSHVSLAGIAIGLLLRINPLITAMITTLSASLFIERLRATKKVYGESALSIFLSGSLAVAIILLGIAHGFSVDLFSYLFGSIVTVKQTDVLWIAFVSFIVGGVILAFYKELLYITFDEETAQVTGIPTTFMNTIFVLLAAITVTVAIPIVGILLISALMVIPVVAALQFKMSFKQTIVIAEVLSLVSVVFGIISSFYLNIPSGGAIVCIALLLFIGSLWWNRGVK